jgi:hypothetical protein
VRRASVTAGLLCAAIGAGCATHGDDGDRPAGGPSAGERRVVVNDRGSRLPSGCRPAEVARLLNELRLRAVIVGYANGLGQIEFRAAGRLHGKGAVDCETGRLVAVGLGLERERMAPLCGRPHRPVAAALACARDLS